jgi:hypothetical protein
MPRCRIGRATVRTSLPARSGVSRKRTPPSAGTLISTSLAPNWPRETKTRTGHEDPVRDLFGLRGQDLNLRPSGYELTQGECCLAYKALGIIRGRLTLRGICRHRSITGRHPTSHDLRSPRHRQVTGRDSSRCTRSPARIRGEQGSLSPRRTAAMPAISE